MGENVRKGQVDAFNKGADRSLKDMATPTLFKRVEIVSTVFTAVPVQGSAVAKGDSLEAHLAGDAQSVQLVKGHLVVGRLDGDGNKVLVDGFKEAGAGISQPMEVTAVSEVSGFFKVVLANGKAEQ
jgi:hypothetical protein